MRELVLVKYHQPESKKGLTPYRLDGIYDHPSRYVYCICWLEDNKINGVSREGWFQLDENLECGDYLGYYQAQVIERNLPESRLMDKDYYELAEAA